MTKRRELQVAFLISLSLTAAMAGCDLLDPAPGSPPSGISQGGPPPSSNTTVSLEIGRRIFGENCARCHGDSAQGTSVARNIQGLSGVATIVRTGNGAMPPFASFSNADIQSIELFLGGFKSPGIDTLTGGPLFQALCARCHGPNAEGITDQGPGLQLETGIAATVRAGRGNMPAFPKLTDQQIASLEAFFRTVPFERTGRNLYVRYCTVCHGADARGVRGKGNNIRRELDGIQEAVREGPDSMPTFPMLTNTDIQAIRQYIESL